MTEYTGCITRLAEHQDMPHLKALWKTVFGDDDADIDLFFSTWFSPALTVVIDGADAVSGGTTPVSAAYILPVGALVLPDGERLNCAMLYAIATLPEFRGRGYGEAVTRAAAELAAQKGYPAVVLKPADDGLFAFYAKRTGFNAFFEAFMTAFTGDTLPPPDPRYTLSPVSPSEYRALRQRFLANAAYIDMNERGLAYQLDLSAKSGGGLYALLYDGKNAGCAAIEREDGVVSLKELLLSEGRRRLDAVSAIAQLLPAEKYDVRSLSDVGEPESGACRRFGMLAGCTDIPYVHSAKWYGLAFD